MHTATNIHYYKKLALSGGFILSCFFYSSAQLKADFTISNTNGCAPLAVNFTNTTSGASSSATYYWDFGNGNTSALQNPGTIYTKGKAYTISLTVKDGNDSSIQTKNINIAEPPVNNIAASFISTCAPATVVFKTDSTGGNFTYTWDFGDGSTQQTSTPSATHIYTAVQTATVSLTVSNSIGCTKTLQSPGLVEVYPSVNAAFTANRTDICRVNDAVQFTNNSNGPGTLSYLWNFGDGNTSTAQNPSHVFTAKGAYNISLTVNSSTGCTATTTKNNFVNVANFATGFTVPTPICLGSNTLFQSTSTPAPTSIEWYIDGTTESFYNYNSLNYYFNQPGTHVITLKNIFGTCRDSITKNITVFAGPSLKGFIINKTSDCGAPVTFNFRDTTSSATAWEWSFNPANTGDVESTVQAPSYTYTDNGGYNTKLTVTNAVGCSSTVSQYINIQQPALTVSEIGDRSVCGPYPLTFNTTTNEVIVSYQWLFSDGGSSSAASPTHMFSKAGNWSATLNYKTAAGCLGTVVYGNIIVFAKPLASFTTSTTNVCGNSTVEFNAVEQPGNTYYFWDFGEGYPGFTYTGKVTHQYATGDTFTVTLVVANQGFCFDTLTRTDYIKVLPPFTTILGAENSCDDTRGLVTFYQSSPGAQTWKWDFGDGISASLNSDNATYQHTYNKTGYYTTYLTTTNGACAVTDSFYTRVLLKQNPRLTANAIALCSTAQLPITVDSLEKNTWAFNYSSDYSFKRIEYSDNSLYQGFSTKDDPNTLWTTVFKGKLNNFDTGKSALRIILKSNGFNCLDTTNYIPIKVNQSKANFAILTNNTCYNLPVSFKDLSVTNNKIAVWRWTYGDGITDVLYSSATVSHQYSEPGLYNVSLFITDTANCSSYYSATQSINVYGPQTGFTASTYNTFVNLPVNFTNNTNTYNSVNTQYLWTFGDGSSTTDFAPSHTYASPGFYEVKLTAFNSSTGCADTSSLFIDVQDFGASYTKSVSFITNGKCPPMLVKLMNKSYNYTSVKWDFGDGTTADNVDNPNHIYYRPGQYLITLTAYGAGGMTAVYKDSVYLKIPQGSLSTNVKEGCIGLTPSFNATVKNASSYYWDYGDGTISKDTTITSHQFNTPGRYIPLLLMNDSIGCTSVVALKDTIYIHTNPVVTILPKDPLICRGKSVTMIALGGATYSWSPASGLSSTNTPNTKANPLVTSQYAVTVKDEIGCASIAQQKVTVVLPGEITVSKDTTICVGSVAQLDAGGATYYQWINTTNALSNTEIKNPQVNPVQTTTYTVKGTDQYRCFSDTATVTVTVIPLPTVSLNKIPDVKAGTTVTLSAVTSSDVMGWSWWPGEGLSCTNCQQPVLKPFDQVTYSLTVTNKGGCTATDSVKIRLQCQEARVFIPTAFSPNGDGKNDVFSITGISIVKHMVIYSRWGKPVYERNNFDAKDRSTGWDGTSQGFLLPPGTYVYFIEMDCPTGGPFSRTGTVTLVR